MSNKQLSQEYKNMMGAAAKMAFITAVRRNHEASLADVAAMAEAEGLGSLTVAETFFDEVDFGTVKALPASSASKNRKAKSKDVDAPEANTRTPAARAEYEKQLFDTLKGERRWVSAQELRTQVGGTPLQARKALNRLIERGLIKFRGKARATKYRTLKKKSA